MAQEKTELRFSIVRHFGVIARDQGGWTKELNLVSWNGRDAKYDIRSWAPDKKKMRRGITLSGVECESLRTLLNTRFPQSTPSAASSVSPSGN
ncbi:YdbC family protein [Sporolactobacillus vineae]|uniref:YdbC family protein n=1 Tax=Sporolactobacillus vineae TaxID=444463 RepID=UPI000288E5C7|nr:PC4/YdbC family ssDNA-binding protein [Sporolactobacillus vineae]